MRINAALCLPLLFAAMTSCDTRRKSDRGPAARSSIAPPPAMRRVAGSDAGTSTRPRLEPAPRRPSDDTWSMPEEVRITGYRAGMCNQESTRCWPAGRGKDTALHRMRRGEPIVSLGGQHLLTWYRGEPELRFESTSSRTVVNGRVVGLDLRSVGKGTRYFSVNDLCPQGDLRPAEQPITPAAALAALGEHRRTVEVVHLGDDAPAELVAALALLSTRTLTVTVTSDCPDPDSGIKLPDCWQKTRAVVERLVKLKDRIHALEIVGFGNPSACLDLLPALPALRFLWLNVDVLDLDGARHLGRIASLGTLVLRGGLKLRHVEGHTQRYKWSSGLRMALVPGALAGIVSLRNLRSLDLGSTDVTKAELRHLAPLTGLLELYLDFCRGIDDEALRELAPLRSLRLLNLDATGVKGSGLAHLKRLSRLQGLSLRDLAVVPETFEWASRLGQLRSLDLRHTHVREPENARDKQSIPHLFLLPLGQLGELRFLDLEIDRALHVEELAAIGRLRKVWASSISPAPPSREKSSAS